MYGTGNRCRKSTALTLRIGAGIGVFIFGVLLRSLPGLAQSNDRIKTPAQQSSPKSQSPFELKVRSNLVVVRVVVRDAQGKPVEGLKKEDFRLLDRGKEQSIAQFEEEKAVAIEVSAPPSVAAPRQPSAARVITPEPPRRFLALYFDDLDMSDADVIDARDAADRYLAANLQSDERVALFTTSAMLSDFTVDLKQIHDALFRLHPHPRAGSHSDCPDISDYEAQEISEHDNPNTSDAWRMALDEAVNRCHLPKTSEVVPRGSKPPEPSAPPAPSDAAPETVAMVRNLARSILAESEMQAQTSLQALEQVVNLVSRAPGQRSIILVSPGFLSQNEQYQLDRIVDRALRSQVVISSLDPRGLALLMRESDITSGYTPSANSGAVGPQHTIDTNREMVATDVLAEVAEGTGGEFFHNNNDLAAGFRALAGLQGSYILAFAPADIRHDGKFHSLKVTLAEKHSGFHLQARRGYFAPKQGESAEAKAQQNTTADPDAQSRERIREAAMSKTDSQQLPVELRTEVSKDSADSIELSVWAHLDTKPLHFHKEGERNQNTVIFVSVIFDRSGKYVTGQQRQAKVDLPDESLPNLLAAGMDVKITFQLKPGSYTVREVVMDSEDHQMTAFSRGIEVQ